MDQQSKEVLLSVQYGKMIQDFTAKCGRGVSRDIFCISPALIPDIWSGPEADQEITVVD